MLNVMKRLWSTGVGGNPVRLRRQIALCNQVVLFAIAATTPYQFFYFFYNLALYRVCCCQSGFHGGVSGGVAVEP